jgi:hypothetical protein
MQTVKFTVEELDKMLRYLDELPHKISRGLIDHIQSIAKPQLETSVEEPKEEAKGE